ncbi:MAG: sulfatase [Actinomycetota bacterium]|nr:sulfatase [Actinomycetota bacterium]
MALAVPASLAGSSSKPAPRENEIKLGRADGLQSEASKGAAYRRRPNILLIVTDDQRASGLEHMPATKRYFQAGGVNFRNAYATTPLCCPARASIFSGQYMHNHKVFKNQQSVRFDQEHSLERYLNDGGYFTGIIGKFLNGGRWVRRPPNYFDRFIISKRFPYYDGVWNDNGVSKEIARYSTSYMGSEAVEFLSKGENRDPRPWFLVLGTTAPHAPYTPQDKYADAKISPWYGNPAVGEKDKSDKPPYVRRKPQRLALGRSTRQQQIRTLMSLDDMVRRIFLKLRSANETRRTLAVYISDNGFLWGEHGLVNKTVPYTMSIRVPMFMRWPRKLDPGTTDYRISTNVDLAPTLLDAAGLRGRVSRPMDGHSLLRTGGRSTLLTEYREYKWSTPTWASIRTRKFQYIEYFKRGTLIFREFYRLTKDPWQLRNLLKDDDRNDPNRRFVARLHDKLNRLRSCRAGRCP